jgi:two-component system cell cycle response regulator DivK
LSIRSLADERALIYDRDVAAEKILVIDDHAEHLYFFRKVLGDAGYAVVESQTAEGGLALAFSDAPRLIILDLVMPDTTGWGVARQLRADPRTAKTPVFLVTAFPSRASEQWDFDGDCDALLVKPVEPTRLLAEIKRWI